MKYDALVESIDQHRVNLDACHKELVAQKGKKDALTSDVRSIINSLGTLMQTAGKEVGRGADQADYEKDLGMDFSRRGVRPEVYPGDGLITATHKAVTGVEAFIEDVNSDGSIKGDRDQPTFVVKDSKSWNATVGSIKKRIEAIREHGS